MKLGLSYTGADRYVIERIERFDQKNEMLKRATWEPEMKDMARGYYARFNGLAVPRGLEGYLSRSV